MTDKAIIPLKAEPPELKAEPKPVEMAQVEAQTISKFADASTMELTAHEQEILARDIPQEQILLRPCQTHREVGAKAECPACQLYLDWGYYANILDEAFGKGNWSLTPAPWSPKLYREGNITYREYVLWIRGRFAGNAVGHHEEFRKTANFGDAAEATYANALTRCCKRLGIARDLWRKNKIDEFRKHLSEKSKHPTPLKTSQAKSAAGANPPMDKQAPSVTAPAVTFYDECRDMIKRSETIDDLKAMWSYFNKVKEKMTAEECKEVLDMKNAKKAEIEKGVTV